MAQYLKFIEALNNNLENNCVSKIFHISEYHVSPLDSHNRETQPIKGQKGSFKFLLAGAKNLLTGYKLIHTYFIIRLTPVCYISVLTVHTLFFTLAVLCN